jgi:membrane protease YdiL (CAAX protease family)
MIDPSEAIEMTPAATALGVATACLLAGGLVAFVSLARRYREQPPDWQQAAAQLRARPWHWRDLGVVMLVFLLAGTLAGSATAADLLADNTHLFLMTNIVIQLAVVMTIVILGRLRGLHGRSLVSPDGQPWSTPLRNGLRSYFAIVPIIVIVGAAWFGSLWAVGVDLSRQAAVTLFLDLESGWQVASFVMVAVVLAPLVEELVFRGLLLPLLLRKTNTVTAVVIGGMVFALIHQNIAAVLPLFALATCMSVAYLAAGNLLVPIVMHATFNAVSLALLWLGKLAGLA